MKGVGRSPGTGGRDQIVSGIVEYNVAMVGISVDHSGKVSSRPLLAVPGDQ